MGGEGTVICFQIRPLVEKIIFLELKKEGYVPEKKKVVSGGFDLHANCHVYEEYLWGKVNFLNGFQYSRN